MSATLDSVEVWSGKGVSDENFPVGSRLIRANLRVHVHAFYDFARNADDIADSPDLLPDDKLRRLNAMSDVLEGRSGTGSPSAAGLRASLTETAVTSGHALDLLRAFRQDATKTRYANWPELMDYCRYSAMPVGRHVLDLHGEHPSSHPPSDALCAALQVLNHLQDCRKDLLALDRCYLPADMLSRFRSDVDDLQRPAQTPGLRRTFDALLDQTDALNRQASELPRRVRDRRLRLETAVIVGLSHRLARRLRLGDPVATRVKLTKVDVVASVAAALQWLA